MPMCPCTGMPAFTIASMYFAWCLLPSHFITSAPPCATYFAALSTACCAERWKLMYGMSTMRRPYFDPRLTACAMNITSSNDTEVVVSWPNSTMPPVSETHRMSMPTRSAMIAVS